MLGVKGSSAILLRHQHANGSGNGRVSEKRIKSWCDTAGQGRSAALLDKVRCAGVNKVFLISLFVEEQFNCSCLKCADRSAVISWKAAEGLFIEVPGNCLTEMTSWCVILFRTFFRTI